MSHAHPEIEALLDYTDQLNGLVSGHQQEVSQLLNVNEQLQDSVLNWAFERTHTLRVDTHRDNHIMQHNILKHGFTYCGIIYLLSGDERLAYQKTIMGRSFQHA